MDATEKYSHNIYDLFDDDYRQCNITFEQLLGDNPDLFGEYCRIKERVKSSGGSLYGARGIIYKALFDRFKDDGIFDAIGVLDDMATAPLVSNARMILNYLNYYTYSVDRNRQKTLAFEKIVEGFKGIICKEDIDGALMAMFKLGYDSAWNELVAFNEIHDEEIESCAGLEVFITKAGHEYLSLIATHFEFFNTRVSKKKFCDIPLFSIKSLSAYQGSKDYKYNFEETIGLVFEIVKKCCRRMSEYHNTVMKDKFSNLNEYMQSPYVYSDSRVLHGERVIHTHIRYIDTYRIYVLCSLENEEKKREINEILVKIIEKYIEAGKKYSNILTEKSTSELFPKFKEQIRTIRESEFYDFTSRIDV